MNTTINELKRRARQALTGHYRTPCHAFITLVLLALLLTLLLTLVSGGGSLYTTFQYVIYYLASFCISLLISLLQCGLYRIQLEISAGRTPMRWELFFVFKNRSDVFILAVVRIMLLMFICSLPANVCSVSYVLSNGQNNMLRILFYLFLIIGVIIQIIILLNYALVYFLLLEHPEMSPGAAFRSSRQLMRGHKRKLFFLNISFVGLILLGVLSLGLGFIWISPYMIQSQIEFYREITSHSSFDRKI